MADKGNVSSAEANVISDENRPDITVVIDSVVNVFLGKKKVSEAIKDCALAYKDDCFDFAKEKARTFLEERLQKSKDEKIRNLSETDFSTRLVDSTAGIMSLVHDYYKKNITLEEMIRGLSNTGIKDVAMEAMDALRIPEKMGAADMEAVLLMAPQVVAYNGLTAAYKELRKAYEDEQLAYEERIKIEAECARVVEAITRYRMEMEQVVSQYLSEHYDAFEKGFAAMDQAILDNDIDGYIRGNVEIQKVLGYHVQFTSQDEFDELMMSDEAFKL